MAYKLKEIVVIRDEDPYFIHRRKMRAQEYKKFPKTKKIKRGPKKTILRKKSQEGTGA